MCTVIGLMHVSQPTSSPSWIQNFPSFQEFVMGAVARSMEGSWQTEQRRGCWPNANHKKKKIFCTLYIELNLFKFSFIVNVTKDFECL